MERQMKETDRKMSQKENFLLLLDGAIHDRQVFLRQPVDYEELLVIAQSHEVYALVVEKLREFREFRKFSLYETAAKKMMCVVAAQTQRTYAFLRLYETFTSKGIYPIAMKGIVCRRLYGELCDHRPSGDEDILIRKEEYHLAEMILKEQGYLPEEENLTSAQLDELQEIGFHNRQTGLYIELHLNPMGHENDLRYQMNTCFVNVFDHYLELDFDGVMVRTMNHTDHFLYLVLHAFRHFTAGGFGIRQVLDILLYKKQFDDEIDSEYLKKKLSEFDALLFLADIIYIGNHELGFTLQMPCSPNCPEDLLDDLMYNGVFGNGTQAQRTAQQITSAAVAGRKKVQKSSGAVMLRTIFPDRARMLNQHPELQEKPWLLPVRWVQRWGRFLQHSRSNHGNLAKESMEISKRRIKLLKKYKII